MSTTIITCICTILGGAGIWTFLASRFDKKSDRDEKLEEQTKKLDKLIENVNELKVDVTLAIDLSVASNRDKLNYLAEKYMKQGYISATEYSSFKGIGDSYIAAGGNSDVRPKYEYCINNLEVK